MLIAARAAGGRRSRSILLAHAWVIPELYAAARRERRRAQRGAGDAGPSATALGLLGDLVGHEARDLHARTGLVLERGALGVWLVGEAGALLCAARRRVHCWCVRVPTPTCRPRDRIAHLLLALRADEQGFATVANLAFAGARWRVRAPAARQRCARRSTRPAGRLDRVVQAAPS